MRNSFKQFIDDLVEDKQPDLSEVVSAKIIKNALEKVREEFLEDEEDI